MADTEFDELLLKIEWAFDLAWDKATFNDVERLALVIARCEKKLGPLSMGRKRDDPKVRYEETKAAYDAGWENAKKFWGPSGA